MTRSLRHLVSVSDFSATEIAQLMQTALRIKSMLAVPSDKHRLRQLLKNSVGSVVFYESSTRTRFSFGIALALLGMQAVHSEAAGVFSSAIKGESIEDTIKVLAGYSGDVIILRHPETGSAARAAAVSTVPIINAGDGTGEHPTQALLDLFTILEARKNRNPGTITLVGDLKNGRTVHSLVELVVRLSATKLRFASHVRLVSPPELGLPAVLGNKLRESGIECSQYCRLERAILEDSDVVYTTRVQKERGSKVTDGELLAYQLTPAHVQTLPETAIIMHPLPRNAELPEAIDKNHRARYFEQAHNGVPVRMAILLFLLHPLGLSVLE
jgi:aspartate carbamoyltransferase catalytic subunit